VRGFEEELDWSVCPSRQVFNYALSMVNNTSNYGMQLFEITNKSFLTKLCDFVEKETKRREKDEKKYKKSQKKILQEMFYSYIDFV